MTPLYLCIYSVVFLLGMLLQRIFLDKSLKEIAILLEESEELNIRLSERVNTISKSHVLTLKRCNAYDSWCKSLGFHGIIEDTIYYIAETYQNVEDI